MEKQRLRDTLRELQDSLRDSQPLDPEARELVEQLATDLQQLLRVEGKPTSQALEPVATSLHELLLRFETEHPQITGILGRIASSLANLGI